MSVSLSASICTARTAAFFAPAFPIATVATGMPGGIWTVLRRASIPPSPAEASSGTPIIGRAVLAARAPAKCAAIPAAAIITFMPFSAALSAKSAAASGVRWADIMRTTGSMPKPFNWSIQLCITGRSLSEPMTTATVEFFSDPIIFPCYYFRIAVNLIIG